MNNKVISKKIVGIDLGTTNSVVSVLEGGNPTVIVNSEGNRTTPSVVAYTADGQTLVGQLAKRQAVLNPQNTFSSIKRFIGCKYDEVEEEINRISYSVKKDAAGNIKISSPILKKDFSPEEISAAVLKKLANDASRFLQETVTQAIITVPAYFNDSQRLATKDAGTIAGLNVLRILNEPTAAALAYGLNKKNNEVILIFDLGGGTFDVSILEVGDEVFEVLSTSGDTHLGGDDFDQAIVDYIVSSFKKLHNIDLYAEKQSLQRIIEAAEKAKIELSTLQSTSINLPFIAVSNSLPLHINLEFDRSKFEELSKNLLQRCRQPLLKALQDAKLNIADIDKVILVGGSTRIPAVRNLLIDYLGKPLNESVNPDEVVAMGAAVQAGIIAGEITDLILLDVTPLSLGVETMGGLMTTIINRNASIPVNQSEIFSTGADYQDSVEIHVLQGERPLAKDNKSLGIFKLNGIPPALKGTAKIKVTFQLDVNGILAVSAREEESGQEQSIKIEGASVLPREEVSKMIKDAEENSKVDRSKKALINISYEFDNFLSKVEKVYPLLIPSDAFIPQDATAESLLEDFFYVQDENFSDHLLPQDLYFKEDDDIYKNSNEQIYFIGTVSKIINAFKAKELLKCYDLLNKDFKNAVTFLKIKYLKSKPTSDFTNSKIIDTDLL
jgi:molecular chaperone DnaK